MITDQSHSKFQMYPQSLELCFDKISINVFSKIYTFVLRKTAARALSKSFRPWSTADFVIANEFDCGINKNDNEESSDLSVDTDKLVIKAQKPPKKFPNYIIYCIFTQSF